MPLSGGVDVALAGGAGSIYDTLEKVRPDVVALGYDQIHNPSDIEAEAQQERIGALRSSG